MEHPATPGGAAAAEGGRKKNIRGRSERKEEEDMRLRPASTYTPCPHTCFLDVLLLLPSPTHPRYFTLSPPRFQEEEEENDASCSKNGSCALTSLL